MKVIKLGLLGLGTVGGGLVEVINANGAEIERRTATRFEIAQIAVRDLARKREVDTGAIAITDDAFAVVNNPEVEVVVELIGGTTLAKDLVESAIKQGKHVVTANKALIALHGNEIFALAREHGVQIYFEAAVAGGIPVIKALREGLAGNQINWLAGIINGTGNYILTEMKKPGADFGVVLKAAQDLGYAEADPTFDVEGIDAAHKLTILASLAFGTKLDFSACFTEGISKITADDIRFAQMFGYEIKHLGIAERYSDGFSLRVHPAMVSKDVLIANVNGVMNAVLVNGNQVGSTMYYGPGAGAGATASAVMADLVDLARNQGNAAAVSQLGFMPDAVNQNANFYQIDQVETEFYLRFKVQDHAGVMATISQILADFNVSIEHLHQEPINNSGLVMIALTTSRVSEGRFNEALAKLEALDDLVDGQIAKIRVTSF